MKLIGRSAYNAYLIRTSLGTRRTCPYFDVSKFDEVAHDTWPEDLSEIEAKAIHGFSLVEASS